MVRAKKPIVRDCILQGSVYVTFLEWKDRFTGLKKIKVSMAGEQMGEVMKRKRRDDDGIKNIQHLECVAE